MRITLLVLLGAATETFYTLAQLNKIEATHAFGEIPVTLECSICLDACTEKRLEGPMNDEELFLTDVLSCRNKKHMHFYHKYCLIEWMAQDAERTGTVKCPSCQSGIHINIVSIITEELYLISTGRAFFYPSLLKLVYCVLDSNILRYLLHENSVGNLENLMHMILACESEYKITAIADITRAITVLKSEIDSQGDLLAPFDEYEVHMQRKNDIFALRAWKFFTKNNPSDFIFNEDYEATTGPFYNRILEVALMKFAPNCPEAEQMEKLVYKCLISDKSWLLVHLESSYVAKQWLSKIPVFELLEKKINASLDWVENEQKHLALTTSIAFCIRVSSHASQKSFLCRMVSRCFSASLQNTGTKRHFPKTAFMIDFIDDFYSNLDNRISATDEYPWFVYDFICAKTVGESHYLKEDSMELFDFVIGTEAENKNVGMQQYYFVNTIINAINAVPGLYMRLMESSIRNNRFGHISMQLRHSFYQKQSTVESLFNTVISNWDEESVKRLFASLLEDDQFLNYKNYPILRDYIKAANKKNSESALRCISYEQMYNTEGMWKFIPESEVDRYCKKCIHKKEYEKIDTLIFGCNNKSIIKMLSEEAVEKIVLRSGFFSHLNNIATFLWEEKKSSLFVRHNFIQIFEMKCQKYDSIAKTRLMQFFKHLNISGFSGSSYFVNYKHIFKYIAKRDDAFELLNSCRTCFSSDFNFSMIEYITRLIAQKKFAWHLKKQDFEEYKEKLGLWYTDVTVHDYLSNTFKNTYKWCSILKRKEACSEAWDPYGLLEKNGLLLFYKMSNDPHSEGYEFTQVMLSFIPRRVVEHIRKKIFFKEQRVGPAACIRVKSN
ncbi:hypothetical protein ENBRE01_1637 [Enteropsectra breve]|nr:hypothetical protein ENBRE01_1637 [Enteropsectra breve]